MTNNDLSFFEKFNMWLRNSLIVRLFSIGFLMLILLIPTEMIKSLIRERESTQRSAIYEVSSKWGDSQTITGPVVTIPYKVYTSSYDKYNKLITLEEIRYAHFLPKNLKIEGELFPEIRYRGIYEVILYTTKLNIKGNIERPNFKELSINNDNIIWKDAYISIGISDMRGIEEKIDIMWGKEKLSLNPGLESKDVIISGLSTKLNLETVINKQYEFSFDISLKGSQNLNFVPLGKETNVILKSSWNNPSFSGAFLPDTRNIDKDGFTANWKILHLNREYPQQWKNMDYKVSGSSFGLNLLIPVDEYQKTMRTAKYAIMFIALTFLVFFFVEIFNKNRIHPIQYLLTGLALIIFYTLLLSFSEHMKFNIAYILSSISVIILITIYAQGIFKNIKVSMLTGSILTILYGFLFVTLQLQDYALLLGSIGLFTVLSTVMFLSRNIDWYNLSSRK